MNEFILKIRSATAAESLNISSGINQIILKFISATAAE